MDLQLNRFPDTKGHTAGRLYSNGEFVCNTLEDEVREIEGRPVAEWKVKGKTAIPRGRYRITMRYSPRFKRNLPWLRDVPGFTYILIHRGNLTSHTEGCILVGMPDGNERDAWLGNSAVAERKVVAMIDDAIKNGEEVWITIA